MVSRAFGREVHQRGFELAPISHHGRQPGPGFDAHGDRAAERLRQDVPQAVEQSGRVDPLGPQVAAPGKGKQPMGDCGTTLRRAEFVRANFFTPAGSAARCSMSPAPLCTAWAHDGTVSPCLFPPDDGYTATYTMPTEAAGRAQPPRAVPRCAASRTTSEPHATVFCDTETSTG